MLHENQRKHNDSGTNQKQNKMNLVIRLNVSFLHKIISKTCVYITKCFQRIDEHTMKRLTSQSHYGNNDKRKEYKAVPTTDNPKQDDVSGLILISVLNVFSC